MTTLAQRWRNVELAMVSPTLAQRSKLRCTNVANLRWANGAAYVGPT